MSSEAPPLENLERYRQQLENNLAQLRKALRHWQQWEIEYEGVKEEVAALPDKATGDDIHQAIEGFGGKLVDAKETKELLGLDRSQTARSQPLVLGVLDRRIEYVHKNVETVQKQLDAAESKHAALDEVESLGLTNEQGLPVQDIYEELDDDGNVVSGKLVNPGDARSGVLEALKHIGLKEKDLPGGEGGSKSTPAMDIVTGKFGSEFGGESASEAARATHSALKSRPVATMDTSKGTVDDTQPRPRKKSVSFAPSTKPPSPAAVPEEPQEARDPKPAINGPEEGEGEVLRRNPNIRASDIRRPNESLEDASLRAEMLSYTLNENAAIVAQMDILEGDDSDDSSYWSDDGVEEWTDDIDPSSYTGTGEPTDSDDDSEEDEHGMSRRRQITASYKAEMEALQERLQAQMTENLGPRPAGLTDTDELDAAAAQDAKILRIRPNDAVSSEQSDTRTKPTAKLDKPKPLAKGKERERGVRFAQDLDIAPAAEPATASAVADIAPKPAAAPFKDSIVERAPVASAAPASASQPKKVSRFKASLSAADDASSSASPDHTNPKPRQSTPLSATVVERPTPTTTAAPKKRDPAILQRDLAMQRRDVVSKMINRQGGYLSQDVANQAEEQTEEEGGRKVSRFKAARLNP